MKKSQSLIITLTIIILLLSAGCMMSAPMSAAESVVAEANHIQQNPYLRATSGATIEYQTQNGQMIDNVPSQTKHIPHLVLHRNGALTASDERTLIIELDDLKVTTPGITVTLVIETQRGDPDQDANSENRITVWREEIWLHDTPNSEKIITSVLFAHLVEDIATTTGETRTTPTGYFRIEVMTREPGEATSSVLHDLDYAFLMENQVVASLPKVAESSSGAAPDELVVTFCDMFPFQNSTAEGTHRLPRAEVPNYVQMELVPQLVHIFRVQTDDWGFPWHEAWTSYRNGENAERLSVTLSDGRTWYHDRAPSGAHAGITLNVSENLGSARYDNLTDRLLSLFKHELFHNMQRNIAQHYSSSGDIAGKEGKWAFFSEGTAVLASTIGESHNEFTVASSDGGYLLNANKYIGGNGLTGNLNDSYKEMEAISTAIYWRFLYEQCGGLDVIRQVLVTLYSGEIVNINETTDIISWLPKVLDQTLANTSCPFTTYQESLNAFAHGLYALHMQQGRCKVPGESGICGLCDPNHMYATPTTSKLSYSGEELRYGAAEQTRPTGVPASFGTDFIEIEFSP